MIFVTLFLERILRATGGGARAGVRQGQRQLLGGDGLLCERLHLGKVKIMTMSTNFLSNHKVKLVKLAALRICGRFRKGGRSKVEMSWRKMEFFQSSFVCWRQL